MVCLRFLFIFNLFFFSFFLFLAASIPINSYFDDFDITLASLQSTQSISCKEGTLKRLTFDYLFSLALIQGKMTVFNVSKIQIYKIYLKESLQNYFLFKFTTLIVFWHWCSVFPFSLIFSRKSHPVSLL